MSKFTRRLLKMKDSGNERFCGCYDKLVSRAIDLIYAGKPTNEIDFSSLPSGYCHECNLPVNDEKIKSINNQIDLILPSYEKCEIQMPKSASASAKETVEGVLPGVLPVEVARRLDMTLNDVNRHIRSGRLSLDASGKFVSFDSFDELQRLIRSN